MPILKHVSFNLLELGWWEFRSFFKIIEENQIETLRSHKQGVPTYGSSVLEGRVLSVKQSRPSHRRHRKTVLSEFEDLHCEEASRFEKKRKKEVTFVAKSSRTIGVKVGMSLPFFFFSSLASSPHALLEGSFCFFVAKNFQNFSIIVPTTAKIPQEKTRAPERQQTARTPPFWSNKVKVSCVSLFKLCQDNFYSTLIARFCLSVSLLFVDFS